MSKRPQWALAVALAAVLVLTACGGSSGSDDTSSPDGAGSPAAFDRDATLRVGFTVPALALDPHTTASDTGQYAYTSLIYDRLTEIVAGPELAPMLATTWEFAPDGKSATFTLRDDVTFSDGAKLDAEAVKLSLDRALNLPSSTAKSKLSMISSVDVEDPTHVKINTIRPAADLPYALAGTYGSIISPKALDNEHLDIEPVGSGPYTLTDLTLGKSATFQRRDGYWDTEAAPAAKIELIGLPDDNARLNALRSGQIDLAMSKVGQVKQAKAMGEGYKFFSYPAAATYAVLLNANRTGTKDVKVRQAINFAIDRDAINKSLLNEQCEPNIQPLTPGVSGYLEDPPIEYTYDPGKAKSLLAEAGFANDSSMKLVLSAGLAPQDKMAPAIQDQLKQVGINVEIAPQDSVQVGSMWAQDGADMYLRALSAGPTPAVTLSTSYLDKLLFPGPVPAELTQTLETASDPNADQDAVTKSLEKASQVANEQALVGFLCAVPTQVVYSTKVQGADQMGQSFFQGIIDLRYVGLTG